jgi:hypothetical protein
MGFIFDLIVLVFLSVFLMEGMEWVLSLFHIIISRPWDYVLGGGIFLLLFLIGRKNNNYRNQSNNDLFPGV